MSLQHSAHSSWLKKGFFSLFSSFGSVGVWGKERIFFFDFVRLTWLHLTESYKVKASVHPAGVAHSLWENVFF